MNTIPTAQLANGPQDGVLPPGLAVLLDTAGLILGISDGACELLRETRANLLGRSAQRLLSRSLTGASSRTLRAALRGRLDWHGEVHVRGPRDATFRLDCRVMHLTDADQVNGWRLVVARAHGTSRRAVRANRFDLLGQLAGGVLHDVSNAVATLSGHVALADAHAAAGRLPKLRDSLAALARGSEACLGIVGQLRDFARGVAHDAMAPVALDEVARTMERLLRPTLGESTDVHVRADTRVLTCGIGLPSAQQCALNLIVNAREVLRPHGGRITLAALPAHDVGGYCNACGAALAGSGPWVALECSDTGPGFAAAALRVALIPLGARGLDDGGIGLAIVAELAHRAGGHLMVTSRRGFGSSVRVLLRPSA